MSILRENALTLLSSTSVNMQTNTKQAFFTVPVGKKMVVDFIGVRNPSATLVGAVDTDFGSGAGADDWILQVTLAGLTGTTHTAKIAQPDQAAGPPIVPVQKTVYVAGDIFGCIVNTDSTGAATVTMDLFGYMMDA